MDSAQREISFFFPDFHVEEWMEKQEPLFRSGQIYYDRQKRIHTLSVPPWAQRICHSCWWTTLSVYINGLKQLNKKWQTLYCSRQHKAIRHFTSSFQICPGFTVNSAMVTVSWPNWPCGVYHWDTNAQYRLWTHEITPVIIIIALHTCVVLLWQMINSPFILVWYFMWCLFFTNKPTRECR